MKKLIILIGVFITLSVSGQIFYGENWTSVPENLTPEIRGYILDKTVDNYVACFRGDKYCEDGVDRAPDSDIANVVALHNELAAAGKSLKLIYTFDTRGRCSLDDAFYAWDKFIEAGIDIIAARLGNEEFGKKAGHWVNGVPDFNHYKNLYTPILNELTDYDGVILFTLAKPDPGFEGWNDAAEVVIDSDPDYSGDIHLYWNQEECAAFNTYLQAGEGGRKDHLAPSVITNDVYTTADNFYHDLYYQIIEGDLIERTFTDFIARYPGKKAAITEFGPTGSVGNLGNTLGYEATVDWFLNQIRNYPVFAVCKFNGPGTPTGSVNGRSVKDLSTLPTQVKRLDHYTQKLFLMNQGALEEGTLITQPGSYTFSVHNMTRDPKPFLINLADGLVLTERYYEHLSGNNYYSSSGVCQWWMTGSLKTYEIDDIYVSTGENATSLSYGYLHIEVMAASVPGCLDPQALNYNPAANEDDGSCYYQEDCDCKDREANNYNEAAPCADNSKCDYSQCLKKRWFFSGCKPATKNCNCN